jgi:hydrogenase large subunit
MQHEIEDVIKNLKDSIYEQPVKKLNTQGVGLTHAARGALGHWIKIENGKIANYQIISPTTWNGSPRDKDGNLGVWESALIGLKIKDIDNPMEMGHVIRSFDPCLVCTVHFVGDKEQTITLKA